MVPRFEAMLRGNATSWRADSASGDTDDSCGSGAALVFFRDLRQREMGGCRRHTRETA